MHTYNPNIHHRRSIRLKGYDYSQAGLYFITICTQNRKHFFGEIRRGDPRGRPEMILNDAGRMVETEWLKIPQRFPNVVLHEYVVMPNHFHGIMEIVGATLVVAQNTVAQNTVAQNTVAQNTVAQKTDIENGQPQGHAPTTTKTVGDMVGAFQSIVTVEYIKGVKQNGWERFDGKLFQRNYWEHIIRDNESFERIANYIINNPENWKTDKLI